MGKKRKLEEGMPSPAASDGFEEQVSVHEESPFDKESDTPLVIQPKTEVSWPPESDTPMLIEPKAEVSWPPESDTSLLIEPKTEVSWPQEIGEPNDEPSLIEEVTEPQTLETADPDPNTSVAGEVPYADDHEDDEDNSTESLQMLLEPFSKEQVIDILRDAALKHPDIWASIKEIADNDPAHRKVFVHGLGWNTTAETLIEAFRQYGEIEECNAIVDKITGRSKGYGFILFKQRSSARRALKEPQKKIGNKMTACQLASEGPPPPSAQTPAFLHAPQGFLPSEYTQRKIYVSNVGAELDPNKVLQFFSKFGEIEEGPLGLDKATGKPKGFCLFVYKTAESAKKALEEPHKNFEGNILHCQRAIDGPKLSKQGAHHYHGGGQFAGMQQLKGGFGAQGTVAMGGLPSSVSGPGHLIAPPGIRFNQAGQSNPGLGLGVKNAGLAANSALGNQARGAGGYVKPGAVGGHGASLRIHGSHGNAAVGQGNAWNQQGFNHAGGLGSSTGQ